MLVRCVKCKKKFWSEDNETRCDDCRLEGLSKDGIPLFTVLVEKEKKHDVAPVSIYHQPKIKRFGYTVEPNSETRKFTMSETFDYVMTKISPAAQTKWTSLQKSSKKKIQGLWTFYRSIPKQEFHRQDIVDLDVHMKVKERGIHMMYQAGVLDRTEETNPNTNRTLYKYTKSVSDDVQLLEKLITNNEITIGYDQKSRPRKKSNLVEVVVKEKPAVPEIPKKSEDEFERLRAGFVSFKNIFPNLDMEQFLQCAYLDLKRKKEKEE